MLATESPREPSLEDEILPQTPQHDKTNTALHKLLLEQICSPGHRQKSSKNPELQKGRMPI